MVSKVCDFVIIFALLVGLFAPRIVSSQSEEKLIRDCIQSTQMLFEIQDKVEDIHPFLCRLYPVVIAENDTFFIFNYDER